LDSYTIQVDQKDDRAMVLSSINKESTKAEKVTVGEAEQDSDNKAPVGTYYYISVVPRKDVPELVQKFSKTRWDCVDYICVPTKEDPNQERTKHRQRRIVPEVDFANENEGDFLDDDLSPVEAELGKRRFKKAFGRRGSYKKRAPVRKRARVTEAEALNVTENVIKSSLAARVTEGRKIKVTSRYTGINYEYDVDSNKEGHLCCLCLSVSEHIQFKAKNKDDQKELEKIAQMMIKDMSENNASNLLKALATVYEEEACVICMEDDKPPNVVFYQCGHQCCHGECCTTLQTCPICRRNIAATIKVQPTI